MLLLLYVSTFGDIVDVKLISPSSATGPSEGFERWGGKW